jgi:RNA polymerase subunit RPABC4/transcription elongation factor Spt4
MQDDIPQLQLPLSDKQLVACRTCRRILTREQFAVEGCSSCGSDSMDRRELASSTTAKFGGFVGIVDGKSSWVARLIGRATAPPGVYAADIQQDDPAEGEGKGDDDDAADDLDEM